MSGSAPALIQETPLVRRLVAPNPGPFTGPGTNTYLIGTGERCVVLDPGPDDHPDHIDRILAAAEEAHARIELILVTHSHRDHLPGAFLLKDRTHAPLAADGSIAGVDRPLHHRQEIPLPGGSAQALFTPGHAGDHYCFLLPADGTLFSGDLILGRGSVTVRDLDDYLESLRSLRAYGVRRILPGHWGAVDHPDAKITEYINHRLEREQQVIAALQAGARTPEAMVDRIYHGLDGRLRPAAIRSVVCHLVSLERRGMLRTVSTPAGPEYELTPSDSGPSA